jgi:hypothetical protein
MRDGDEHDDGDTRRRTTHDARTTSWPEKGLNERNLAGASSFLAARRLTNTLADPIRRGGPMTAAILTRLPPSDDYSLNAGLLPNPESYDHRSRYFENPK